MEKSYHELWHYEETLINQRLTWLLAGQGFLFATLALGLTVKNIKISFIVASVGLVTSALTVLGVIAAIWAQTTLNNKENAKGKLYVKKYATFLGWIVAVLMPLTFFIAWVCVMRVLCIN